MRIASFRRAMRQPPRSKWPGRIAWLVIGGLVVMVATLAVRNVRRHDSLTEWRSQLEATSGRPAWPAWSVEWPSLPVRRPVRHEMPSDLRGPYAFAARERSLLEQIPCYCGCVKQGHRGIVSCFVTGFRADGTPMWTDHAFSCPMCVHIVREVMLMSSKGMKPREIREAIDEQYAEMGLPTKTPMAGHEVAHH